MGTWTLLYDTTEKSLKEWGLTHCVITEQSLSMGTFTAALPGSMLGTLPWSYEDPITLKLDGVVKWKGVALSPRRQGAGNSEMIQLRFGDPWYYLTQGQYLQPWFLAETHQTQQSSNVALFAEITSGVGWLGINVGQQITTLIGLANNYFGGGVMQMGDLIGDGYTARPIPQRGQNMTYEAALRQVLSWAPDVIQQWDYSTTPPKIHFVKRAAATVRTYSFADGSVMMSQDFMKRDDLVLRGIQITYLGRDANGNVTSIQDQAGETTGSRILRSTIDLGGSAGGAAAVTPQTVPQKSRDYTVVSESIDVSSADWWFEYGDTGAASADDIAVGTASSIQFAPNAPENAGFSDLGGCGLQWLSGGIPKTRLAANTRVALVTGYLTIRTVTNEDEDAAPILTTTQKERRIIKMLVPVTKLQGEYTQVISEAYTIANGTTAAMMASTFTSTNVAAQLLAAWGVAQYDGSLRVVKDECDEAVKLGDVINVTGGLTEWETMKTQVHSISREIDTGTTTIETGSASHLGIDEYISQLRLNRMRNVVPASDIDQQAKGEPIAEEPSAESLDDLVGPGSIKYSVLLGPQELEITRAESAYKVDMTAETEPVVSVKDTETGDEVKLTPGATTLDNDSGSATNKQTPAKIELTNDSGDSVTLSIEHGLQIYKSGKEIKLDTDGGLTITQDGKTTQLDLLQLLHDNGGGNTNSVTDEQIVISSSGGTTIIEAAETSVSSSGNSTAITPAQVLLTESGGSTNSLTGEQMVINAESATGIYGASSLSQVSGSNSAELDTGGLTITQGDDTSQVTAEGGFKNTVSGGYGQLNGYTGLDLNISGGTVVITPQADKAVELRDTDVCDEDDAGEPVKAHALVLRSLPELTP